VLNDAKALVVVSGASSGIGQSIARHLIAIGWRVLGLDVAQASLTHADYQHHVIDLTDAGAVEQHLQNVNAYGFVHAAGVMRVGKLGQLDLQGAAQMWGLHDHAAAVISNALLPHMLSDQQGRIVFIGSRVSQGLPGRGQYAATKAALVAMAKSWAAEVAASGVTVNVVSPAATDTGMLNDPLRAGSQPRLPPIGRLIQPQEIAELVAYLLSPSAAAITGQEITICGGSSLHQ
jgi:3-oxoacyl-[acyl-carrier protein] reductase